MRHRYVIAYDIAHPKRLRRVFRIMREHGFAIQFSVFHCALSERECAELKQRLAREMDLAADQVIFIHLGPVGGRADSAIDTMGRPSSLVHKAGPLIV